MASGIQRPGTLVWSTRFVRRSQRPDECLTRTGASGDMCDVQLDRRQRRPLLDSPLGDSEDGATSNQPVPSLTVREIIQLARHIVGSSSLAPISNGSN